MAVRLGWFLRIRSLVDTKSRGVTGHICGGCATTLSTEFLAELLKLVDRISLSRETDKRKEWERVDARQWNKHIIIFYSYGTLHPPALARAKAFLQQSVNSFWILGERCLTCFPL